MISRLKMTVVLFTTILLGNGITARVNAQEANSEAKKSTSKNVVSEKQLETWIDQLSEGNFRERRNASNNLLKVGKQALSALVKGAQKNDAERSARCVDIITRMYKGKDETLKTAAEKALAELEKKLE